MRKYIKYLTAILSGALLITGLYQVEIMWIQRAWEFERFVMPFGIEVEWWIARDIWYSCIVAGYLLLVFVFTPVGGKIKEKLRPLSGYPRHRKNDGNN